MRSGQIWVLLVIVALSGCVSQGHQGQNLSPSSVSVNRAKILTVHGTVIYYRDLSRPSEAGVVKSSPDKHNDPQTVASVKTLASSKSLKHVKEKTHVVPKSESVTPPMTTRIVLNHANTVEQYDSGRRGNQHTDLRRRVSDKNQVGFWQWLFGKRQPEPKPTVVNVVPRPDPEFLNQPNEVLFKHAKTDQLQDGQLDILLALSSQANTTAIYEVRGTAGYKGDKAERIGRERAEFIKQTLINAGVSRTKIRIMAYDPSIPGLKGVVTLREAQAI